MNSKGIEVKPTINSKGEMQGIFAQVERDRLKILRTRKSIWNAKFNR